MIARRFFLCGLLLIGYGGLGAKPRGIMTAKKSDEALFDACMFDPQGKAKAVKGALDRGALVNFRFENSQHSTPLIEAAEFGNAANVQLLLNRGARVNVRDASGKTALFQAAQASLVGSINLGQKTVTPAVKAANQSKLKDYEVIVGLLLSYKADPNIADDIGMMPLGVAAYRGHYGIVAALLKGGAQPNHRDGYRKTPLEWAAYEGYSPVVKLLQSHGSRINPQRGLPGVARRKNDVALVDAITHHDLPQVKNLLARGADPNAPVVDPYSTAELLVVTRPLFASFASPQITRMLLAKGASVDACNADGQTPLMEASAEVARILLKHGAQVNRCASLTQGHYRETPLIQAALDNDADKVQLLLAHGARVDDADYYRQTALMLTGSEAVLSLLRRHGANINARNYKGVTPLLIAVRASCGEMGDAACCDVEAGRMLLKHGANPNARDAEGNTALMLIAQSNDDIDPERSLQFARLLLKNHARIDIRNKKSLNAWQIAKRRRAARLLRVLRSTS